jgi:hypothetical protein
MVLLCALSGVVEINTGPMSVARPLHSSEYKRLCTLLSQYWRGYNLDIPPALCVEDEYEFVTRPLFPLMASHPNDVVTFELQKWLPLSMSILPMIMGYIRVDLPPPTKEVMLHSLQSRMCDLLYIGSASSRLLKINLIDGIETGFPGDLEDFFDILYGGIRGPKISIGVIQGVGGEVFDTADWFELFDIHEIVSLRAPSNGYTYEPLANFAAKCINSAMVKIYMHGGEYDILGMPLLGDLTQSKITWYDLWVMGTALGGSGTWEQLVSSCTVDHKRLYPAFKYGSLLNMSFEMQVRVHIPPVGYISINGVTHQMQDLLKAFEEQDFAQPSKDLAFMDPSMTLHTVFEIFVFMKIINDVNDIITHQTVHFDAGHNWRHQKGRFVRTPTSFQMPVSFGPTDRRIQPSSKGPRSPHNSRPGTSGTTIMTPLQAEQALESVLHHLTTETRFVRAYESDMPLEPIEPEKKCEESYSQFPFAHASPPANLQEGLEMVGVVAFKTGLIGSIPGLLSKTTLAAGSPIWFEIGAGIEQHQPLELLHTVTNPVVTDLLSQIRGWCPTTEKWSDFDLYASMSNLVSRAWRHLEMPQLTGHDLDIMPLLLHGENKSLFFSRFCPEERSPTRRKDLPHSKAMLAFALENASSYLLYNAENYYYPGCSPMFSAPHSLSLQADGPPRLGDTRFLYTAGVAYNELDMQEISMLLTSRSCPLSLPSVPILFPGLATSWPTASCMHKHTGGDIILPKINSHFLFVQVAIWLWLKSCSCTECKNRITSGAHYFRVSAVTMFDSLKFSDSFSHNIWLSPRIDVKVVHVPDLPMLLASCAEEHKSKLEDILSSVHLDIARNTSGVSRLTLKATTSEIIGSLMESSDVNDRNTHYVGPGFQITFK